MGAPVPLMVFTVFMSCCCIIALVVVSATRSNATIYDHLRLQGLPVGLLPKGISEYRMNSSSGEFKVFLSEPCNAKLENQLHYDSNITGTLRYGRIAQLSGVSAQELFLWFPVKGIRVDVPSSGLIHFDVGVVHKQFSLSLFESPPDCTAFHHHQVHSETLLRETANAEEDGIMLKADS